MCEMMVRQRLVQFWITNKVFIPEQFGFLKGKSCLSQLLSSFHDWAHERIKGCYFFIFRKLSTRCHMNTFSKRYTRMISKVQSCLGLDAFSPIDTSASFCGDITHLGLPFCLVCPKEPCWDLFYFSFILMISQEMLCQTQNSLQMM